MAMLNKIDMRCIHCNAKFAQSYLRWHFARRQPSEKCHGSSTLTCRKCGCWTPVRWQFEEESR